MQASPTASPTTDAGCPVIATDSLPTPLASETMVRIQSVSSGYYLCDANGTAVLTDRAASNAATQWVLEAYQGAQRIRNRATGHYLSIEHLTGQVEVIPVEAVWMSPRWTLMLEPLAPPSLTTSPGSMVSVAAVPTVRGLSST